MSFDFSPDQKRLAQECRAFAVEVLAPLDAQIDREARIGDDVRRESARRGYTGRLIPAELGGLGGGATDLCIQQENLAYGSITVASSIMATNLCLLPIVAHGSRELQARYLPPIRDGEWVGTIGITEPETGSDAAAMTSTATRSGDGWRLNGAKRLIDNTTVGMVFLTWARTDPAAPAHRGLSAFVVQRDFPGFQVDKIYDVLGVRGLGVGAYSMHDCRVPPGNLLGQEGDGWQQLMRLLEVGRTATAALCVGLAQAALDEAKRYALQRRAFGTTLSRIGAIQSKVAEMAVRLDTARLLVYRAASHIDAGIRSDRESSMAKFWAADAAFYVSNEALQIFGGIGCTSETAAERHLRDARIFMIGEGTGEIQRLVVARREFALAEAELAAPRPPDPADPVAAADRGA